MDHPNSSQPEDGDANAEALVGHAGELGAEVGHGAPDLSALYKAIEELQFGSLDEWRAFEDAFVAGVLGAHVSEWTSTLEEAVVEESATPKPMLSALRGVVRSAAEEWSEELDPSAIWVRHPSRGPRIGASLSQLASPLLAINPSVGLSALESLPFPHPLAGVLAYHVRDSPDRILDLVSAAGLAFDAEGHWLADRPFSALVATHLIVTDATDRYVEAQQAAPGVAVEAPRRIEYDEFRIGGRRLPDWLTFAFQAAVDRDDGGAIALRYLTYLVRVGLTSTQHPGIIERATTALASVLRGACIGVGEAKGVWQAMEATLTPRESEDDELTLTPTQRAAREGEGARQLAAEGLPALLGAVALLGDPPTADDATDVWVWFKGLLVGRDPALSFVCPPPPNRTAATERTIDQLATLFARLPDPCTRIQSTYSALQPQRRRLQFRLRYKDLDMALPSIFLLRVSVALVSRLRALGADHVESARAMLLWTFHEARRLWLAHHLDVYHEREHLVTECFAAVPSAFGPDLGQALDVMLPPIVDDPVMLANASCVLEASGADIASLMEHAGGAIETALRVIEDPDSPIEADGLLFDSPGELAKRLGLG